MPLFTPNTSIPVLNQFSLKGKFGLVTGGAGGIGVEIVRGLAEAGADVAFTYLTNTGAANIAERISQETGQRVKAYKANVCDREDITSVVETVNHDFGHLDVVVANAGVCAQIPSLDYTEETWARDYAVNVEGVMWTAQAAGKIFQAQGHGNLIITASVSSVLVNFPQPQSAYNSSKAAAAHLGKNLAVEWVDFARVNCVSPGYVATNMTLSQPEAIRDNWTLQVPGRRMAEPAELRGLYVFLASDASSFMTGANVICDGGYSLI
ncbi:Sorbose reductase-like protein SOU2 [Exophiala dermatitidis]|uniref:Gluconate 5-dehydrogenase n=1 Tax=Exophiala dermatitidis (strain ATCC 34100 / CBS 525.76 / NIH/UT8656) TaxID=858893 RepID=H6C2N2_EXODN|nr:gluconate 5-dehydrogenase [Exophiala dermatitidis NIH/UT8656]EHY57950.1 gluconate 5-dehydrogenase [Exophiala dermatitidis NIH/UT8656]